MKIIDSNPATSTSATSLNNKTIGSNKDVMQLTGDSTLTAGSTWKGRALTLLSKVGVLKGSYRQYQQRVVENNNRAKDAVYKALKERFPTYVDIKTAFLENRTKLGHRGMDSSMLGSIALDKNTPADKNAMLTCGQVRSLFDAAAQAQDNRNNRLRELAKDPTPANKERYEQMLGRTQENAQARNLDEAPHPKPKNLSVDALRMLSHFREEKARGIKYERPARPERAPEAATPAPTHTPEPKSTPVRSDAPGDKKVPLFSPQERTEKQVTMWPEEQRLYDGSHAQERYNLPPKLLNHVRVQAFMDNHANLTPLMQQLGQDVRKLESTRLDFVHNKMLEAVHTQAKDPSILKQEVTRAQLKGLAKQLLKESTDHGSTWSKLHTPSDLSVSVSREASRFAKSVLKQHESYLDRNMMSVFADEVGTKLTSPQEKFVLSETKKTIERTVKDDLRNLTSEQVADVAKEIIRTNFVQEDEF